MEKKSLEEWKKVFEEVKKEDLVYIAEYLSASDTLEYQAMLKSGQLGWEANDRLSLKIDTLKYAAKKKLLEKYGIDLDKEKATNTLEKIRRAVEKEDMDWVSGIKHSIKKVKEYISPKVPLLFPSSPVIDEEIALYVKKDSEAKKRKLSDLGTSEEELEELKRKVAKIKAKYWLKSARERKNDSVLSYVQWIKECLIKAGVKPEEVGTSEKELIELQKKGHKCKAEYWLNSARKSSEKRDVEDIVKYLRGDLIKAGLGLESIGTSEKELEKLKKEGYKAQAEYSLRTAREKYAKKEELNFIHSWTKLVREYIEKAEISLEDIETSKEELRRLESVVQEKK